MLKFLDAISSLSGRVFTWLILGVMLFTCAVVILRYLFGYSDVIFYQELVIYLHASAFMLAVAWTLKGDAHVRVDVLYRSMGVRAKAWVNIIGSLLFLLPVSCFLLITSFEFASQSWAVREVSAEAGGIPAVFLLKSVIPVASALLILQGLAELIRNSLVLFQHDIACSE
jgi:TRAP-type mannitol/chloroaromatic compound transport system permease small subunit